MYLSTISEKDASSKRKVFIRAAGTNLVTSDIEGSQPRLAGYQYFNKPSYSNSTEDIERSSPKPLHQQLDRPEFNLTTKDIDKAFPSKVGFQSKRIGTNPLSPVYNLASFETRPFTPPKFIRDSINITDIDGTKPEIYYKWRTRDAITVNDIEGAQPKPFAQLKKQDFMDPRDINRGEIKVYNRITNPLMPEYVCRDQNGEIGMIGPVEGSIPKKTINFKNSVHTRHLDNRDIEGSTSDTVGLGVLGTKNRNFVKKIVDSSDIEGAQSGSLKKGITTIRITNPLEPKYVWKTEDTPPPEVVKKIEEKDLKFSKNTAKFWGASQSASETKSPPHSKASSRKSDFNRNANRFYSPDLLTTEILQKDLKKNTEKFFDNSPKRIGENFESVYNQGSIHKPKPKNNYCDVESMEFQKNTQKFYNLSRPSSNGHADEDFAYATSKISGKGSDVGSEHSGYQFNLSRKEIGNPMKKEVKSASSSELNQRKGLITPGSRNDRKLLSSAAKNVFT